MADGIQLEFTRDSELLIVAFFRRLTADNSDEVERRILEQLDSKVKELVFDFMDLTNISSAGLRVALSLKQLMRKRHGTLHVSNAIQSVRDVFDLTGLSILIDVRDVE